MSRFDLMAHPVVSLVVSDCRHERQSNLTGLRTPSFPLWKRATLMSMCNSSREWIHPWTFFGLSLDTSHSPLDVLGATDCLEWAERTVSVLQQIRERYETDRNNSIISYLYCIYSI